MQNHRIKVYDKSTFVFLRFLGNGLGSAPGQFHRPMELCISADDCSLCVVDGYNHRVQLILLPELQILKKKEAISSRMERKSRVVSSILRPSKISLQADISLLRFNLSKHPNGSNFNPKNENSKNDVNNQNTKSDQVYLLFPPLGFYVTVPNHDVQQLLKIRYFSELNNTENRNIPQSTRMQLDSRQSVSSTLNDDITLISNSTSSTKKSLIFTSESCNTTDSYSHDKSIKMKNTKRLNNQAKVFMDLITDVVNDSNTERNGEENTKTSPLNNNITPIILEERNNAIDQGNMSDIFNIEAIDFNLIVPSVFAMHALLERSWHPDEYLPDTVIKSLVHLMCQDDVERGTIINNYERKRIIAASSALLIAIVNVGTRSSEIVFLSLLSELRSVEIRSIKSNLDLTNSTWGDTKIESKIYSEIFEVPEDISNDEIIVSPQGLDRNSRADSIRGRNDEGKCNGENMNNDMYDDDDINDGEVVTSLRLLAILLRNMCKSIYPFPFPYHSISPVVHRDATIAGTDSTTVSTSKGSLSMTNNDHIRQQQSSKSNINTSNYDDNENFKCDSYEKDIQVLVVGQCWMNDHKNTSCVLNASSSGKWEGRSLGMKFSNTSLNNPDHSPQSTSNRQRSVSREKNLLSPLNTECLNLLDCVYKINKSRQSMMKIDINALTTDIRANDATEMKIDAEVEACDSSNFNQTQLDLLIMANRCFSQVRINSIVTFFLSMECIYILVVFFHKCIILPQSIYQHVMY